MNPNILKPRNLQRQISQPSFPVRSYYTPKALYPRTLIRPKIQDSTSLFLKKLPVGIRTAIHVGASGGTLLAISKEPLKEPINIKGAV